MLPFDIPLACASDAVGCDDTPGPGFGIFDGDAFLAVVLLVIAVLAVTVATILIRRRH